MSEPYWYGLLLIVGMFLLLTVIFIIVLPIHLKYSDSGSKKAHYSKYVALIAVSLCFYLAWGFVLPATRPLYLGDVRIVFEIIFIVCSSLLGLLMILFYCFLTEVRQIYCLCCAGYKESYDVSENTYDIVMARKEDTETGDHFANLSAKESFPDYDIKTNGVKSEKSLEATGKGEQTSDMDSDFNPDPLVFMEVVASTPKKDTAF